MQGRTGRMRGRAMSLPARDSDGSSVNRVFRALKINRKYLVENVSSRRREKSREMRRRAKKSLFLLDLTD